VVIPTCTQSETARTEKRKDKKSISAPFQKALQSTMNAAEVSSIDCVSMHGTPTPQEIVTKLEALDREQSVKIRMKCGDLTSAWKNATAVKKDGFFQCIMDENGCEPASLPFDDEKTSLLSVNLWEMGWFSLSPGQEVIFQPPSIAFDFNGKRSYDIVYESQSYTLFPSCTVTVAALVSTFNPKAKVCIDLESGFVYFMAAKSNEPHLHHMAVVYNCIKSCPEFIALKRVTLDAEAEKSLDLDLNAVALCVKSFIRSAAGLPAQSSAEAAMKETGQLHSRRKR
jgi:hypothetical protein